MGFLDLFRVGKIKKENEALKQKLQLLHADEYFQISERLDKMNQEISDNNSILFKQREEISSLSAQQQKLDKQVTTQANKLSRYKELYRSVEYALDTFLSSNIPYNNCRLNPHDKSDFDCLAPSVILQLHSMDVKELRKAYKDKLATTSSTGGLSLALQRAIVTARPKGRYRKHFYWPAIKRYYWNLLFSIPLLAHLYISELLHLLYCRLFQHNIL